VKGKLATPHGVASGPDGTVYVADMKSHRVLAIDAAGVVTTVAGVEGEAGSDAVHLNRPAAVLVLRAGCGSPISTTIGSAR